MSITKHLNKILIILIFIIGLLIIRNEYYQPLSVDQGHYQPLSVDQGHYQPLSVDQGHLNIKTMVDNYNKPWYKPVKSYNSTEVNTFSLPRKYISQFKSTYSPFIGTKEFEVLIKEFNSYYVKKDNIKPLSQSINTNDFNKKTWINRYHWNPNKNLIFDYIKSTIPDVNKFNNFFITKLNEIFKYNIKTNELFNKIRKFKFHPFYIYKYKINKYYKEKDYKIFTLTLQLFSEYSILSPQIYTEVIFKNKDFTINKIYIIGYDTTADILIQSQNSNLKDPTMFNTINSFDNQGFIRNSNKYLKQRKIDINEYKLKNQYACFNIDSNIWNKNIKNFIIRTNNKMDCEKSISWYGKDKPYGVWDRECKSDSECSYYKANKNYDNVYGKCLSDGYCQFPINTLNLGYHFTVDNDKYKEKCYNCDSKKWLPVTKLGQCCEEQKDKNKYPFLKSPDYAFKDDVQNRVNAKLNGKNIGLYKNYYSYPFRDQL